MKKRILGFLGVGLLGVAIGVWAAQTVMIGSPQTLDSHAAVFSGSVTVGTANAAPGTFYISISNEVNNTDVPTARLLWSLDNSNWYPVSAWYAPTSWTNSGTYSAIWSPTVTNLPTIYEMMVLVNNSTNTIHATTLLQQ